MPFVRWNPLGEFAGDEIRFERKRVPCRCGLPNATCAEDEVNFYIRVDRSFGEFFRRFRPPAGVRAEGARVEYQPDGAYMITLRKSGAQA